MTTPPIALTTTPRTEQFAAACNAISAVVAALQLEKCQGVAFTPADCASLAAIQNAVGKLYDELDDLAAWNVVSPEPRAS